MNNMIYFFFLFLVIALAILGYISIAIRDASLVAQRTFADEYEIIEDNG